MAEINPHAAKIQIQSDLSQGDLDRFLAVKEIAVDCEMTGLNPHRDRLCLVQICDLAGNISITKDPSPCRSPLLRQLLGHPDITKVFHFAIIDCSFILKHLDTTVEAAYCTKIASKLARTYSPTHSLAELLSELLSIDVDKTHQTSYLCGEHLTVEQLEYVANDVRWLIRLRHELEDVLAQKGHLPTGLAYTSLNQQCQDFLPTLVQLYLHGWKLGVEGDRSSVFAY